jgi:hypothetical protein
MACRRLDVHADSVPQFGCPARRMAALRALVAALLILTSPKLRLGQVLDVVHHAVKVPQRVDRGPPSVIEPGQALVVPQVGKHRRHRADALAAPG